MKAIISKKMKEASVLMIAVAMLLSTVVVTADTNDNRAVSLSSCTNGSNHMIFGSERIFGNGETLLWDNGDPDVRNALSCCYWPETFVREIVDDFDIDGFWLIDGGFFRIVTSVGHNADFIDGINVFFYEDIGNKPSVDCYARRVAEFDAYNTGNYYYGRPEIAVNVTFDIVELATDKWWVCFQPVMNGNCFWLTSDGYVENVWASYPDAGYPKWTEGYTIFGEYYDVSFKLFGINQSTPIIEIGNISRGVFKVSTVIKNNAFVDATMVNWSITLDGSFILLGQETTGSILSIPAGEEATISSSLIFGFGKTVITVTAKCAEGSSDTNTRDAFVFLFFIF